MTRQVLVVDDEPMLRNLLSRLLRMEGYDVIEAGDGAAALDVVASEAPDLVLLDVMMPARDGIDVLGDLRKLSEDVRRLRRKIEDDPDHPRWITTVRGVGYRFES